jgi:glucokinase
MANDWLLGIEIGGTKLQLGLGRRGAGLLLLERRGIEPSGGAVAILEQIKQTFRFLLEKYSLSPYEVRGVGVGFGGPVDTARGRTLNSFQVSGWTDFPLAGWIKDHLGVSAVAIANDADTAGLAEARLGAGVGYSPLLYLTIGSGIGGALIVDGQIYRGAGMGALEIGHVEVLDPAAAGPRMVQLEEISSGWGIARAARDEALEQMRRNRTDWIVLRNARGDPGSITAELVALAAIEGDARAEAILDRARRALGFALRLAVALLAPRRIILGGGVSLIGERHWFRPLRELVDADVFPQFRGSFDIVAAALGEEVVVHGALALADDVAGAASRESSGRSAHLSGTSQSRTDELASIS